jgi:hypothetical protein
VLLPANTYKGQTAPVDTLAVMAVWATHDGVSDQMAYEVTKALYENTETLGQVHPKGKEIALQDRAAVGFDPAAPGRREVLSREGPHQVTRSARSADRVIPTSAARRDLMHPNNGSLPAVGMTLEAMIAPARRAS